MKKLSISRHLKGRKGPFGLFFYRCFLSTQYAFKFLKSKGKEDFAVAQKRAVTAPRWR